MKCFLIGDYNDLLEGIEAYLQANFFYVRVCEKLNSYAEAEKMLYKTTPDLILIDVNIDIEIPAGFLRKVRKAAIDVLAYPITPVLLNH